MKNNIDKVSQRVKEELNDILTSDDYKVPIGVSGRHVHLSIEDLYSLFGEGYALTPMKDLSQPHQYAAEETVTLVGPKGSIEKVRILGPARKLTQVELAKTDAIKLGVKPPIRQSGDVKNSASIIIKNNDKQIEVKEGVIIAARHIHMHTKDAIKFEVRDKDMVKIFVDGERAGIFHNVLVRVSDEYALDFHVDTDEGNAFAINNGQMATIIPKII